MYTIVFLIMIIVQTLINHACVMVKTICHDIYVLVKAVIFLYLHLPRIPPIKCVGGPSAFMRAWLQRYENQQSATYIVLLSAHEVVDVNG